MGIEEGGWFTRNLRATNGIGLQKVINKELKNECMFELGNGGKIRFWEDIWCEDIPLCETFPSLYTLGGTEGATVAEVWEDLRERGACDPTFLRPFNDWEMEAAQNFISEINSKKITPLKRETFQEG